MTSATAVQTVAAAFETQSSSPAMALETIAHELRQPLSAIESIAYYLNLVLPRESGVARSQAARLQQLVEQANWILTCSLQLADLAPLAPQPLNLEELITQTATARALQGSPAIRLDLAGGLPLVLLDPGRARILVENLLFLFRQVSSDLHPVRLSTSARPDGVCLAMATAAPGFRTEACLGPGCSLGIASARRVVENHGGRFSLEVDSVSGIKLTVVLP